VTVTATVVGCGAVAQRLYHAPLKKLERQGLLRVVGLVDRHLPHAETMRPSFPHARLSDDLTKALESNPSDLTLVLSPAQLHAEHAICALRHKNHVLCEKPMAATEAKCAEMIAAARDAGRLLAVGMIRRFFPSFARLRDWVTQGELGEVRSFSYREGKVFDWDVKTPAGFVRDREGGAGLLSDIGPHAIDYLIWLFGTPTVTSCADDALVGGVESNLVIELETPVCPGSVQLSWDGPLKNELRVVGSKAEAVLRVDEFSKLAIKKASGFEEVPVEYQYPADLEQPTRKRISPRLYTQSLYCQMIQLLRAIRLGEPPAVSGESGRECVGVIEAARRLAQPIEMPWLDPGQQTAYQDLHWRNARWERS
jgi:predicted dehydrogenase